MSIKDQVRTFIKKNFYLVDESLLVDDASLLEQGIIDSTGVLEVIAFLEDTFGIAVEDSEMLPANLDSLSRITAFVERKRSA